MEKIRRVAYVVILGGFVGAAALCVLIDGISHAMYAAGIAPPWAFQAGSVPILRDFDDPAGRILRLLTPEPHYKSIGYVEPEARTLYARWHGATFVAILILVLGVRRWRTFRGDLTRLPPPSFGGAAAGIAFVGLALMALGWLGGWRLLFPIEPINAGAIFAFVAFLMSELWRGSTREAVATKEPAPRAAATRSVDGVPRPRRRPIWTVLGLVLPVALGLAAWAFAEKVQGLGAVAVLVVGVAAGLGLGAIATVVAIVRRERWVALQVLDFLVNFGIGVPLIAMFTRH